MAAAVMPSSGASTSNKNLTDEEGRWAIIGICLNKVLTPSLRKVLGVEIPKWYQTLVQPPEEIDRQTFGKFVKKLSPSAIKLNYDSINNNAVHKSTKMYDYAVKDPLSLAKLFMKPFMASFTGFDHTMDTSAVLSVMCEAQPFIACGTDVLAKKVKSNVRNKWAHCDFSQWTEPVFQTALNDIESLLKTIGLTKAEEQTVLDDIDMWRNNGIKLCFGNLVDSELINLIRTEVGNLQESVTLFHKDIKDKERLLRSLETIQSSLCKEICDLRHRQEITEGDVGRLKLEQLTLHNQCVSNKCNIQDVKNEVAKIVAANDEIPYLFLTPKRNPWFGGRLSEQQDLENLLQLVNVSQPKVNIAAVCGLGGVGKTSLAIEYAHQKKNYYTGGVYWFSGEDDTTFENSVYDVATRFGTQSDSFGLTFSATLATIRQIKSPWLVVLDNMDQLSLSSNIVKLVSGTWQHDTSGHLLITTRRKPTSLANDIRDFDERCCLNLKCFKVKEGKEFLLQRIRIIHDEREHIVAEKLVQKLGGLPLALEQAAAYIKSLQCTLSQYLEQYDKQRLRLLNRQKGTRVSEYDPPERLAVRTTWLLNFEHIKQTDDDGQAASRFLNASAFFSANEIQSDIINVGKPPIEDDEFCESVKTALGRQQILKLLTDFSLFKETISSNLSVHHLVQEVIRGNLSPEGQLQSIIDAIRMLHYAFQSCSSPDELHSSEKKKRPSVRSYDQSRFYKWHKLCSHSYELVKHLKRVIEQLEVDRKKIFQSETARIVYECAIHLSTNSKHDEAKKVANFAKDIFNLSNQQVSASSLFPLIYEIPLPEFIRRHIQYSSSIPATSKDKCENGEGIPQNLVTVEQLEEMRLKGNDFFKNGCYNDALKMYCDAIEMSRKTSFFDAKLLSNRASVYLKLGEYEKALQDAKDYILRSPKCWRGYARKALALVELQSMQEACVPASIAYYYNRDVFRNYGPFMSKFGSSFEMRLLVCHDATDLSTAFLKAKKARCCVACCRINNQADDLPIILLKPGDYDFSLHTIHPSLFSSSGMLEIGNCILVGCEGKCSVSFTKTLHIAFVNVFVAYNVNFTNNESAVKVADPSFRSLYPLYASLCGAGELKIDSCKFHNCIRGGLLVTGYAEVKNSEFYDNPGGLEVREGGHLLVSGSKVYGNKQGLLIGPRAKKCVVEDCELYDNEWGGIYVAFCASDVVIKGNRIYDNDEPGVTVNNSVVSIMENKILSNSDWGVCVVGDSQAFVKANKIQKNQSGGIKLITSRRIGKSVIEYNDISFNSGPGIYEEGVFTKRRENTLQGNKEGRNQSTAQSEARLCYGCKKSKTNLQKCCKCYTAQYCGKECQKNDWKSHKQVCGRLLSDASIVLNYVKKPIMSGHLHPNKEIPQNRASGLQPVGPQYCKPPNTGTRFIVKMSAGFQVNELDREAIPEYEVNLYDRSLTIDGKLLDDSKRIYELVRKSGTMGQLNIDWFKLFMWVQGPKDGKLRVFINEFPPYQQW